MYTPDGMCVLNRRDSALQQVHTFLAQTVMGSTVLSSAQPSRQCASTRKTSPTNSHKTLDLTLPNAPLNQFPLLQHTYRVTLAHNVRFVFFD